MNRRRNLILVISGIAVVIALGLFSAVRPHAPAASVRIDSVTAATFTTTLPETGIVQQPRTQVLPALVGGNISTIAVRPGERVRTGEGRRDDREPAG